MTFTAVKLVQILIFASIGKAIAKKNMDNGKSARQPTDRPPNHDSNIPLGFHPEG